MDTGKALVVGGLAGIALYFATKRKPVANAPVPPSDFATNPDFGQPGNLYTGSDLGPFNGIRRLPLINQTYGVLAPINDKVIQPVVKAINESAPVEWINSHISPGRTKVTINPDGTMNREYAHNWYNDNIGSPVSHAGTAVVNKIGDAYDTVKGWF